MSLLYASHERISTKVKTKEIVVQQCKNCLRRIIVSKLPVFIFFFLLVTVVYILNTSDFRHRYFVERETVDKKSRIKKYFSQNLFKGYICEDDRCVKKYKTDNSSLLTLNTCNMLCSALPLWPKPNSVSITNREAVNFNPNTLRTFMNAPTALKDDITKIYKIFLNNLPSPEKNWTDHNLCNVVIMIDVTQNVRKPTLATNERYNLKILKINNTVNVEISAPTYIGAIYALETVSQLIWLEDNDELVTLRILHDVDVVDFPAFNHRGLMIDTARNFFPIRHLKAVVNGMVASKLNILHLHLTDAFSFPIVLPSYPEMAKYGSYNSKVYEPKDIKGLIEYARLRGVRVVLEIDAPGHVNEGWNKIKSDDNELVICGEDDVTNGHLNPDNTDTLEILQNIYKDLLDLGTDEHFFHLGNDEVNMSCYAETTSAFVYQDIMNFWEAFTDMMIQRLKMANNDKLPENIVIWSSPLTDFLLLGKYKKRLVIQFWLGNFHSLMLEGYRVVISSVGQWYLDCGIAPWRSTDEMSACSQYTPWQNFYKYRPWVGYLAYKDQILGGEACLWSEGIDVNTLEIKIWPRAAAMAERLWTDPIEFDIQEVFPRLASHRDRLIARGIKNEAMWPQWCVENPGKC